VATECQTLAAGFSDEEAAEGLVITVGLRALFQRPAAASAAVAGLAAQPLELLTGVPPELLSIILSQLGIRDLACLAATCRLLWCDAPTPPPALPTPGLVETELRRRAEARGLHIGSSLPEGALSWVPCLLKCNFYDALRREAPLAVGIYHSLFVDRARPSAPRMLPRGDHSGQDRRAARGPRLGLGCRRLHRARPANAGAVDA